MQSPKYFPSYCINKIETFKNFISDFFVSQLGKTINTIFSRLEELDVECAHRFVNWFSHHLSNFDWKWNWIDWIECVNNQTGVAFHIASEIISKCIRLSYFEKIKKLLPDEMSPLLPPKPMPFCKFDQATTLGSVQYKLLFEKFKSKTSSDVILSTLIDTQEFGQYPLDLQLDITFTSILKLGCKSISHFSVALERYLALLQKYCVTPELKLKLLEIVTEFWSSSPQHLIIVIDKLLSQQLLECDIVVRWIFSEKMQPEFTK